MNAFTENAGNVAIVRFSNREMSRCSRTMNITNTNSVIPAIPMAAHLLLMVSHPRLK